MDEILSRFGLTGPVTLLVVLGPFGLVPIFARLAAGADASRRRATVARAVRIAPGLALFLLAAGQITVAYLGAGEPPHRGERWRGPGARGLGRATGAPHHAPAAGRAEGGRPKGPRHARALSPSLPVVDTPPARRVLLTARPTASPGREARLASASPPIGVFLCGDVMTGRGIDQVLPHPGSPVLYEPFVRDAREYVRLAEAVNGPIPRPVEFPYIWGDALEELQRAGTDVRIINLETAVTRSEDHWPNKGIHYRMHPRNIGCLTAARIDCCSLANNHVLDWGYKGLAETLQTLDKAGVAHAGAGRTAAAAASPAVLKVPGKGRVLVFSFGLTTSGIPRAWATAEDRAGVNLLEDLSEETAQRVASQIRRVERPGDVTVASIHWGGNWGYEIPDSQIHFAHRLIEEGVDIVHGHSSHHVKSIEVYRDRLILYGCGDFLNDYEGIGGHEQFQGDLALMYLARLDPKQGRLVEARLVPMNVRRFRLNRASKPDAKWLGDLLNRLGARFGTRVELQGDNSMTLRWR
jgi:poly-gamma-glutamate capsule biosynthesis protein CapA/YwtB (metallophosphatase superfamily)